MKYYTVSLFGHRKVDDAEALEKAIGDIVCKLIEEHEYVEFLIGRDGEFDIIAASAIKRTVKRLDAGNGSLTWMMAYMKAEYIHNKEGFDIYYDSIEVCEASVSAHPKAAIQTRNRHMVDMSDYAVLYVKNNHGGAYQTMKYVRKRNVPYVNLSKEIQ